MRLADFTALSTKNCDVKGKRLGRVRGESGGWIVFLFSAQPATIKGAVDDALQKAKADMLVDAVIYQKFWFLPFIVGQAYYVVEGTAVDTKAAP